MVDFNLGDIIVPIDESNFIKRARVKKIDHYSGNRLVLRVQVYNSAPNNYKDYAVYADQMKHYSCDDYELY